MAPSGTTSGLAARVLSVTSRLLMSRLASLALCCLPHSAACSPRRWARTSSDACRNSFTGASSSTIDPMSRPTSTDGCAPAKVRCCETSSRRTSAIAE